MTDLLSRFDFWEGVLWVLIGIWFLVDAIKKKNGREGFNLVCGVAFVMFGISDFVEIHTGSWWRPWWLLVWKGMCLVAFGGLYWVYKKY